MVDTLRIEHLSKTFPGQQALIDVSLDVAAGEVHALVGQNGSGKSTLIKILAGYHQPDQGDQSATMGGEPLTLGDGAAAAAAGIRFVHQDLGLVGSLSTVENLALTNGYRTGFASRIHWRSEVEKARGAVRNLGFADIDVKAPVETLSPAQRSTVAIARALVGWERSVHLLVLDEPTATLPGDDVQRLFDVIHLLKSKGISILYVSHHLDEVFELADRVTVLRDGRKVTTTPVSELDHDKLIELIVGHRIEESTVSVSSRQEEAVLEIWGLRGGSLRNLDMTVYPGEIVGLAGITGSGRENVLGLITGQIPRTGGTVTVGGLHVDNYEPRSALKAGISFVTAERALRGSIGAMGVRENLTIGDVGRHFVGGRLRHAKERQETQDWIRRLDIKASSTESPIGALSGGNQQKVMFAKAMRLGPRVFLLDEPTQGIDVGAKDQIHQLIDSAATDGMAVLVASTDTEELVRLCHRVLVLVEGQLQRQLVGDEVTLENIQHTQLHTSGRAS